MIDLEATQLVGLVAAHVIHLETVQLVGLEAA